MSNHYAHSRADVHVHASQQQEFADLVQQNEMLKAEVGMLHAYLHGICMQIDADGLLYVDGTGAVGIRPDHYYASALQGATLEEDFENDILWAVPGENAFLLDEEVI